MVGLSILPVPAPILPKPAAQELHQESLSVKPVLVPAQMNTAYHAQRKELHQEILQVLPGLHSGGITKSNKGSCPPWGTD